MTDTYDDGRHLFLRATLPAVAGDVRPGDRVRGGVALRTKGRDVLVHPYTFRLVCQNGAIQASATETRRVSRPSREDPVPPEEIVLLQVREAIRLSAAPGAFVKGLKEMRSATEREADVVLAMLPHVVRGRFGASMAGAILARVERMFSGEADRSLYGLMNAVTAVAREEREPRTRWRLEELGGGIPALVPPPRPVVPSRRSTVVRV